MRSGWRVAVGLVALVGCGAGEPPDPVPPTERLTLAELADPQTCAECHPDHYREWSGSMHAYAAEDPVFRAMNARGQRETNGELGTFCIDCHAPMAVRLGLTTDGLNLDEVPKAYQGVTCYYCHQVEAVEGTHNNPLRIAMDDVMRGGIADPTPGSPHRSAYSPLHDRDRLESAELCGSCHDIVTPAGVHIERTYQEWQESLYAHDGIFKLTCAECHMRGRDGVAAEFDGVPLRRVHDHGMPGVDVALTDWPEREAQREAIQRSLDTTLLATMCVTPVDDASVSVAVFLDNVAAGHSFPSGAASDRRAWVELVAYDANGDVGWSSGLVEDGTSITTLDDPYLWALHDQHFDADGNVTHMFWEAARYETNLVPAPVDASLPHTVYRGYSISGFDPAKITMRVRIVPIGFDVLDDLIASGDLDPAIRDAMPTFDLRTTVLEWTPDLPTNAQGTTCLPL